MRDITLGSYYRADSVIHRMDARVKILLMIVLMGAIFTARGTVSFAAVFLFSVAVMMMTRVPLKLYLKSLRPLLILVIFTSLLNMFYTSGEIYLFRWWIFHPTFEGVLFSLKMIVRIVSLIIISSALMYTTTPVALTDALESIFKPLKLVRFPVHEAALMMTLALRFIPTLLEEADKIMAAQKARGADFESGGLLRRAKALIPVLVPLLVSAFRRAPELAPAMECRCYKGGEGRTKLRVMKAGYRDALAAAIVLLLLGAVIFARVKGFDIPPWSVILNLT
ncbi:MAG: energy-coupling factor transporter transmembrane protein EcfT [Clostridia bacterium]|nr:energy-coupling factor transporter transmembrane protein EcfT [Clostridia bacterium]